MCFAQSVLFYLISSLVVNHCGNFIMAALPNTISRLPDLFWNSSNPIFRIDNTDHIMDVNTGISAFEYDQINIMCPWYNGSLPADTPMERFIIYQVSEEEYHTCNILDPQPRIIAMCNNPLQNKFFTLVFRSFSPMPGGLEFHPGKDYYFISTSSPDDLHRRRHGMCRTHNMKVMFKVADPKKPSTSGGAAGNEVLHEAKKEELPAPKVEDYSSVDAAVVGQTDEGHKKQHDKKRKRKRRRKNKKTVAKEEDNEKYDDVVYEPTSTRNQVLNDASSSKIKEKELSYVEKVNNLMKQEAPLWPATGGVADSSPHKILFVLTFVVGYSLFMCQ